MDTVSAGLSSHGSETERAASDGSCTHRAYRSGKNATSIRALRRWLAECGWRTEVVGKVLGVDENTVKLWLSGYKPVGGQALELPGFSAIYAEVVREVACET